MQFHGLWKLIQDCAAAEVASPAWCLNTSASPHPFLVCANPFLHVCVCIYGLVLADQWCAFTLGLLVHIYDLMHYLGLVLR